MADTCAGRGTHHAGHVLMMPFPAHGHLHPVLAVAAELVRRGHRVTFATVAQFAGLVATTGAEPLVYTSVLAERRLPATFDPDYLAREPLRSVLEALATAPTIESRFADVVPDVVLYDSSTYGAGRVLARKWRRPAIEMFPTFASGDRFLFSRAIGERFAADIDPGHPALVEYFAWLTELLSVHDLADVSVEDFLAPADESNLVFLPWEFQLANEGFDDRHTFVGPCLAGPEPDIWSPPGTDPVALVSLGTTSNHHPDFFRQCAAAFEDLPWHVVCTHGGGVEPGELGSLPRNVEVHRWLPHTAVLPYASVFVSQAGMGSVMQALHFGVPQVMVPYLPEQQFIAERAVELGLGLAVRKENISPSVLRDAVLATARDETVRAAVRDMRGHIKAAGGTARAADVVEARLRTGLAMAHMR